MNGSGTASGSIDFGKPFTYMFKDPAWVMKVVFGGLWTLATCVLIGIPVVLGYWRRTFVALVANEDAPLPDWKFEEDIQKCLPLLGAMLCYIVPMMVVGFILGKIPCVGLLASLVLNLAIGIAMPAIMINVSLKGDFAAAFDFAWIGNFITSNATNYIVAIVISIIAQFVAGFGVILLVIGVVLTLFWAMLVNVNAWAQVYRISQGRSGTATPAAPATTA